MNLPRPIRDEVNALGQQATEMIEKGVYTANEIIETIGSTFPYAIAGALLALIFSSGIQEGIEKFKKKFVDEESIGVE